LLLSKYISNSGWVSLVQPESPSNWLTGKLKFQREK